MFTIIGENKQIARDTLVAMVGAFGFSEPEQVVSEIERKGRAVINNTRIMYIK